MRYPKGSIQLRESHDIPLLRQVLYSEFVTHAQLLEFMRLKHYERNRPSFNWRVRRLVGRQLIIRQSTPMASGEVIYSVAKAAASLLQGLGEYCLYGHHRIPSNDIGRHILHAIELNEIHLSVLRTGSLVRWIYSTEIRSQNELTDFGFAKDYDAVVTMSSEGREYRWALEYERSPKAAKYYRAIAGAIHDETQLQRILYIVSNYDLLRYISGFFAPGRCRVFFGLVRDWHNQLLAMPVYDGSMNRPLRLRDALDGCGARTSLTNMTLPFGVAG
ncbi:MAG: hypothetical protein JWO91_2868 [Acidobacteriaceae bacterium]|nr:hypothetical protein [Acidobacteriaceae bacterium]